MRPVEAGSGGTGGDPFASVSRRSLAWIVDVVVVTVLIFVGVSIVDALRTAVRPHPEATAGGRDGG